MSFIGNYLPLTGGTLTGALTIGVAGQGLKTGLADGAGASALFAGSSGGKNWFIGSDLLSTGIFDFVPTTANGGTTIGGTSMLRVSSTGNIIAPGAFTAMSATAIPAAGAASTGFFFSSTAGFGFYFGSGAPTVTAAKGSLYLRSDGSSTSTRLYVATDSAGAWTNVTTAA